MRYNFEDALKLITADDSDISDFSDDDSDTDIENLGQDGMVQDQENYSPDKGKDEEIEVECSVNAKHVYRGGKWMFLHSMKNSKENSQMLLKT